MTPTIGITTEVYENWQADYQPYAAAVEAWGAKPVAITRDLALQRGTARLIEEIDGLLASGGPDVAIAGYPNPPELGEKSAEEYQKAHNMSTNPERDEYELPLVDHALRAGLPILGICRGIQVLNVSMGGRLVLHIPGEESLAGRVEHRAMPLPETERPRVSGIHPILVSPTSRLANAIAPAQLTTVNSRHHQGILREILAEGLEAAAFSPEDGLIEAVESARHRWVIGVQWHPERIQDRYVYEPCRPLFRSFVDACRLTPLFRGTNGT